MCVSFTCPHHELSFSLSLVSLNKGCFFPTDTKYFNKLGSSPWLSHPETYLSIEFAEKYWPFKTTSVYAFTMVLNVKEQAGLDMI